MNVMFNASSAREEFQNLNFLHAAPDRMRLALSTLDVLSQRICVFDRTGAIVMANQAWQSFCDENYSDSAACYSDLNYFDSAECATPLDTGGAISLREGVLSVIDGLAEDFVCEYYWKSPNISRWFRARVSNFLDDTEYLVVVHEDITKYKDHEEALLEITNELRGLAAHLQNVKESERKRIARELHDELGQHLLCMKMDVSVLHEGTSGVHPKFNERLGQVLKCIDSTVDMVKTIINDLRPAALDLGLAAAIRAHALSFQRRTGIFCELLLEEDSVEMDNDRMTTLFRVVQESLVNVARHSNASRVRIIMRHESDSIAVKVSDNGKGMTDGVLSRRGKFGLVGMRERINACGGRFSIDQATQGGTSISASLPV